MPLTQPPIKDLEEGGDSIFLQNDAQKMNQVSQNIHEINPKESETFTNGFAKYYQKFERHLVKYNLEARGIRRVESHERHDLKSFGFMQAALLWFSVNLSANNITIGMLGPVIFSLSFLDASLCNVLGVLLGALPVGYIATFGPRSGCRSLVVFRYVMGWFPMKLILLVNLVMFYGYAMIDAVVAGQILSAVSPHQSLTVVVGIIIASIITWAICAFGYSIVHRYERFAWVPQVIVYSILAGVAGPYFDLSAPTLGNPETRVGSRLSYFGILFAASITYGACAADYFVYYPEHTPRWKIFSATVIGLTCSFTFALSLGTGLASGISNKIAWNNAYDVSQGALIVEGYAPLGGFGKFCSIIAGLGLIANMIPPTYSGGVDFQLFGTWPSKVPRLIWNTLGVLIYTVCALAGRNHLAEIFTNFLALMGYWFAIFIAIFWEERFIFKRKSGFDWTGWNDRDKIPHGIAATLAFLVGWAGAIISMDQVWYVGPIAKLVGDYGADLGNYIGFSWAALVYPPLRYLELRKFGR